MSFPNDIVPENRTKIINCHFQNCKIDGGQAKAYIQNTVFENIKSSDVLFIRDRDKITFTS